MRHQRCLPCSQLPQKPRGTWNFLQLSCKRQSPTSRWGMEQIPLGTCPCCGLPPAQPVPPAMGGHTSPALRAQRGENSSACSIPFLLHGDSSKPFQSPSNARIIKREISLEIAPSCIFLAPICPDIIMCHSPAELSFQHVFALCLILSEFFSPT